MNRVDRISEDEVDAVLSGFISNSLSLDEHVVRIKTAREKLHTGMFETALCIADAVDQLDGEQQELCEKLGMSKGTLSKWISIGSNQFLMSNQKYLPPSFETLYLLTTLDKNYVKQYGVEKGRTKFEKLFESGTISSSTQRKDVEHLHRQLKEKKRNCKIKSNAKLVRSLFGEVRPIEKSSNSLQDIISANQVFNTIVVVPTTTQLSRWRELELDDYVHEDYPVTDLRNTTHDGSIVLLIRVSSKDIEVAIRCLNGWGFTYRDTHFISLFQDEYVIVRGERGSESPISVTPTSTETDDLIDFAENIGMKPYCLVGETTDKKNWTSCVG